MVIKTLASIVLILLFFQRSLVITDVTDGICKLSVVPRGYKCEEHKVTTKDGYILSMQRIPTGRSGGNEMTGAKPPALLQHGLLDARKWLLNPPNESLGFILADNGFDVWLANFRGTTYSKGHTSLSPHDPEYWNWSLDELAEYDLPATVEYVYSQTGQKSHYVGHSVGTWMAIAAFSRNEAVDMVRSVALLCPVAFLGQLPSPLVRLATDAFLTDVAITWDLRKSTDNLIHLKAFLEFGRKPATKLVHAICTRIDCSKLENIVTGPNCCINRSNAILSAVQSTSTKTLVHLSQMVRRGTVAMYDYNNVVDNNKHYGRATPPEYDVTSFPNNLPLLLAYGGKDLLVDVEEVEELIGTLSNHDPDKLVLLYIGDYAHLDFVYGLNANQVVYNSLMAFFRMN